MVLSAEQVFCHASARFACFSHSVKKNPVLTLTVLLSISMWFQIKHCFLLALNVVIALYYMWIWSSVKVSDVYLLKCFHTLSLFLFAVLIQAGWWGGKRFWSGDAVSIVPALSLFLIIIPSDLSLGIRPHLCVKQFLVSHLTAFTLRPMNQELYSFVSVLLVNTDRWRILVRWVSDGA